MAKVFGSLLSKTCLLQTVSNNQLNRAFHASGINMIKVGEKIPEALVQEGDPGNTVNTAEFCVGKKIILFGVPGAFTPFCSKKHLPTFVERSEELKQKGIDDIACVAVNDVFVMSAWGQVSNAVGKVRMFADPNATFTKLMGLDLDIPRLGGIRSKRYSMIVDNGIIKVMNVEPDGIGLSCSLAKYLPV